MLVSLWNILSSKKISNLESRWGTTNLLTEVQANIKRVAFLQIPQYRQGSSNFRPFSNLLMALRGGRKLTNTNNGNFSFVGHLTTSPRFENRFRIGDIFSLLVLSAMINWMLEPFFPDKNSVVKRPDCGKSKLIASLLLFLADLTGRSR